MLDAKDYDTASLKARSFHRRIDMDCERRDAENLPQINVGEIHSYIGINNSSEKKVAANVKSDNPADKADGHE